MVVWEKRRGTFYTGAFFATILLACAGALNAQLLNGSFDTNSVSPDGWQIDPLGVPPEIRQTFSTIENPYPSNTEVNLPPIDGQYFLLLKSDDRRHSQTNFSQISQKIIVRAGQSITGAYFFSTGDYMPYDDTATIKLIPDPCSNPADLTEILLAEKNVGDVGSYQTMLDWETFTHDFNETDAGIYTLTLCVEDAIDNIFTSRLAVDALKIECRYLLAGDINSDCIVNFCDFALLANEWINDCTQTPCSANINEPTPDTIVDFADLAVLAEHWLIDCGVIDPDPAVCVPRSSPQ